MAAQFEFGREAATDYQEYSPGLVPGVALHQLCLMSLQILLHRLDAAGLNPTHLSQLPHHAIVNKPLAQLYDLDVCVLRLPQLAIG